MEELSPWAKSKKWLWKIAIALAVLFAVLVFLIVLGTLLFAPLANDFAMVSHIMWPTIGQYIVVISLFSFGVLGYIAIKRRKTVPVVMASIALIALFGSTGIVTHELQFIKQHGGKASALKALFPSKNPTDRTALEEYTAPNGKTYPIAVFAPENSSKPAPIIMHIHGGSWLMGTFEDFAADDYYFSKQGYLVFDVEYPLSTPSDPTWEDAPAAVSSALAWVGENAGRWNGDTSKIILTGESAGGNLATLVGYAAAAGKAQSGDNVPVPAAIAVDYPAIDPPALKETLKEALEQLIGGAFDDHPERLAAISAETYFSENAPPTFILQPAADTVVVPESVKGFAERAKAAGIDVTLIEFPYGPHAFDIMFADSIANQAWRSLMLNYLHEKGLGPEGSTNS
ncbi:alpha/beta hydrolase [Paenibacillus sanguinis]|uniref:alpha/beta hydrolase n=1 Tax=Paenibacillus sanguinis TaxID=225906 RepID=UPI000377FDF9|nr:alpha/beta hydrolase [Paenibacillus sanguinis]